MNILAVTERPRSAPISTAVPVFDLSPSANTVAHDCESAYTQKQESHLKCLAAIAVFALCSFPAVAQEGSRELFYTWDGRQLSEYKADPSAIGTTRWEIWLYQKDAPQTTAYRWGTITRKTIEDAKRELKANQRFERGFEKFFNTSWGDQTYFNPSAPIADLTQKTGEAIVDNYRDADEKYEELSELREAFESAVGLDRTAPSQSELLSPGHPAFEYARQLKDSFDQALSLYNTLSQQTDFLPLKLDVLTAEDHALDDSVEKAEALAKGLNVATGETLTYRQRGGLQAVSTLRDNVVGYSVQTPAGSTDPWGFEVHAGWVKSFADLANLDLADALPVEDQLRSHLVIVTLGPGGGTRTPDPFDYIKLVIQCKPSSGNCVIGTSDTSALFKSDRVEFRFNIMQDAQRFLSRLRE
jgi:hypothetical protein